MKKIIIGILILGIAMAAGCGKKETANTGRPASGNVTNVSKNPPQGITFNKIKFETLKDSDVPKELSDRIEKVKKNKGFIYTVDDKSGYIYIAVFMGEKATGGYSIEITGVGDSEGRTEIMVKETIPQKGDIVTQVLTQPYTVIRAKGITPNIKVINTQGEAFKQL